MVLCTWCLVVPSSCLVAGTSCPALDEAEDEVLPAGTAALGTEGGCTYSRLAAGATKNQAQVFATTVKSAAGVGEFVTAVV